VGSGVIHHRLLKRHVGTRRTAGETGTVGFGQNASIAATIAATSSAVAEGDTCTFTDRLLGETRASRRQAQRAGGSSRSEAETSPDHS
jgi:hypothetical protein